MSSNHFDLTFEQEKLKPNKMLRLSAKSESLRFPIPALIIAEAVAIHLRKTVLILIFGLLTNFMVSQKIHSEYVYKKEKTKSKIGSGIKWNYVDSDSLVLYKSGTFHRTKFYHYHEIIYSELKGEWKIENDTLILNIKMVNANKSVKNWTKINSIIKYRIKGRKIKPINGYEFWATRNLKRLKK